MPVTQATVGATLGRVSLALGAGSWDLSRGAARLT
jgi:hypothetical protein